MIYSGRDVSAGGIAQLRLREDISARAGDRVVRLTDAVQMREAAEIPERRVSADLFLRAVPGEPLSLTATDGTVFVTVTGETVQAARTRASEDAELERSLRKTGETMFDPGKIEIETDGAFVPVSEINRLRREALAGLEEKRAEAFAIDTGEASDIPEVNLPAREIPPMITVRTGAQAEAAAAHGFRVIRYPEDWQIGRAHV